MIYGFLEIKLKIYTILGRLSDEIEMSTICAKAIFIIVTSKIVEKLALK